MKDHEFEEDEEGMDNTPELKPEKRRAPFASQKKKLAGVAVFACIFVLAIAHSCGGKNRAEFRNDQKEKQISELKSDNESKDEQNRQYKDQIDKLIQQQQYANTVTGAKSADDAMRAQYGPPPSGTGSTPPATQAGSYPPPPADPVPVGTGRQVDSTSSVVNAVKNQPTALIVSYRNANETASQPQAQRPVAEPTDSATAQIPIRVPVQVPPGVDQPVDTKPAKNNEPPAVPPELAEATGPRYRVPTGTILPCTESLRINGALTSNILCYVSIPLYSPDGVHLLAPMGSKLIGRVEKVADTNQERLFVTFNQLIMPDGYTVRFKEQDGLDQIGQTGLKDKVDRHLMRIFGTSIALAAVAGFSQIGAATNGITYSPMSAYRSSFAENVSQNSMQVLSRYMDAKPTFIVREGCRNNVFIAQDMFLPDYRNHQMKGAF